MISYVTVFSDEIQYYTHVAPEGLLKDLSLNGHYMIGAVDEKGESKGAIGFDIVQELYEENPYINIDWLYVDEDHRNKGYATNLIKEVINLSKKANIEIVRAEIPFPEVYDGITDFFTKNGFDFMFTDSYVFRSSIGDLASSPWLNYDLDTVPIKKLSEISTGVYNEGINRLSRFQLGDLSKRIDLGIDGYDKELSMAYVKDGKLMGVYLAKNLPNGTIESGNLFCDIENIGIVSYNLTSAFIKNASKKCGKDTPFYIKCQRQAANRLMEFLMPNWMGEIVRKGRYVEE